MNRDEFLRNQKILRLATIDQKGIPHIVPVWYIYKSGIIYVGTNRLTKKAKHLKYNNRVGFCVDVGIRSPKIFGVMGSGTANLILEKTKVSTLAKKILLKYFITLKNKSAQELLSETDCIIEIRAKDFSVWNY